MKLPEILKRDYVQSIIMILAVILVVLLFWYGLRFAYGTENPILAVASGSMEPVLYQGDLIFVEGIRNISDIYAAPKDADPPGDIAVYQGSSELIVHRVIDKEIEDGNVVFTFRGDANSNNDPEVGEDRVVGRYTGFKIPFLGHIALAFQDFWVKVAFIGVWIMLLVIIEVLPWARKSDEKGEEGSKPL